MHQHGTFRSHYHLDGALFWTILMWAVSPTKTYLLLILQQILHKIWGIEYSIVSLICLDCHYLNLILPIQQDTFQGLEVFYRTWKQQIPPLGPNSNPYKYSNNTPLHTIAPWYNLSKRPNGPYYKVVHMGKCSILYWNHIHPHPKINPFFSGKRSDRHINPSCDQVVY